MTFIASVIAKQGVAVISDSLVTAIRPVMEQNDFIRFVAEKIKEKEEAEKAAATIPKEPVQATPDGFPLTTTEVKPLNKLLIDPRDLVPLFLKKPSHTKDYEEKLFEYDNYTAVTIAGAAYINDQSIASLIRKKVALNKKEKIRASIPLKEKVENLATYFTVHVKEHLKKSDISSSTLIVTNYDYKNEKTIVYKLEINEASSDKLNQEKFEFIKIQLQPETFKVICDGQNRISERILFGELDVVYEIAYKVLEKVKTDFKISEENIPKDYFADLIKDESIITPRIYADMKMARLTELSLQQAVDLAILLMKIEMDFQKYTELIPTVGGVIKIAIIDKKGFKFIKGDEVIIKPDHL